MATPFSSHVRNDCWEALMALGEHRTCERGTVLFQPGMPASGIYLIREGQVRLKLTDSGRTRKRMLGTAGPGAILGLGQTVSENHHKFSAETATAAQVCFVDRRQLLEFLRSKPEACMQVVRMLSEDLHRLYHTLRESSLREGHR